MNNLRSDRRPLYVRAVDALYEYIETRKFTAGQPLPSEDELARQLGVSRSTIREALGHLEKDGTITRRQGLRTFISPRSTRIAGGLERLVPFRAVAGLAGAKVETVMRQLDSVPVPDDVAAALEPEALAEMIRLGIVESIDGCRVAYLEGFMYATPDERERMASAEGSLLEFLIGENEPVIAYARSDISTVEADDRLAGHLGIAPGKSLLRLIEVVFTESDVAIAYFRNYFVTECYSLRIVRRIARHAKLSIFG